MRFGLGVTGIDKHLKQILYLDYRGAKEDVRRPGKNPVAVIQKIIGKMDWLKVYFGHKVNGNLMD